MSTIRLELRKDKTDKQGLAPIRLIYQVKGQRQYYNTGEKLPVAEVVEKGGSPVTTWDEKQQRAVYRKGLPLMDIEIKKVNRRLDEIKREIEKIENRFEANEVPYTAEMVMEELKGAKTPLTKKDTSNKELYAFIDKYIQDHEAIRVRGSLSVYKALKKHLEEYEKEKKVKVAFEKLNHSFFQSFQNFLVTQPLRNRKGAIIRDDKGQPVRMSSITIAKQLSTLKTFLNYARAAGITVPNNYNTFKVTRDTDLEVIALTKSEFETLYSLDLTSKPAWERVRDVFCFSCVTSLRFSDLNQLKREHIKSDYIDLTTIKTSYKQRIPLNPYSRAILKKYESDPRPLPVITNQRSNDHIREICKYAGINDDVEIVRKYGSNRVAKVYPKYELIRMHCGRKTFATLSLENGMRAEYVMKLGGWKDYKSFKRYVNITDESSKAAMDAAWGGKSIEPKLKAV